METNEAQAEVYNARLLSPQEVAKSFVAPPYFAKLARRCHSILLGPRGSGKTTLLKMLMPEALASWTGQQADGIRLSVDYTSVFVPSDRSWSEQNNSLVSRGFSTDNSTDLTSAVFSVHVARAWVLAIRSRLSATCSVHRPVQLAPGRRVELVQALSQVWRVDVQTQSLDALLLALSLRLSEWHRWILQARSLPDKDRPSRVAELLERSVDFIAGSTATMDAFELATGQAGERWALLFDELELAPAAIRTRLQRAPRSVDERLIFKLAMSPVTSDPSRGVDEPWSMHDVDEILLTYPNKEDGYSFSSSIIRGLLERAGFEDPNPQNVLGVSEIDRVTADWSSSGTSYGESGVGLRRIVRLARIDESFRAYLRNHKVDIDNVGKVSNALRAEVLRKVASVVALRAEFLEATESSGGTARKHLRRRSRKNPQVYCGAASLFAVTEGNPRSILTIVTGLIDKAKQRQASGRGPLRIEKRWQSEEIGRALGFFRAYLRSIPVSENSPELANRGLLGLVDKVGDYFGASIVGPEFVAEPPGSFVVDSRVSPETVSALERAANAGAIIYVPDSQSGNIIASVRGKRFRLNFLLATKYQMPLTLMRSVELSAALGHVKRRGVQATGLFAEEEV